MLFLIAQICSLSWAVWLQTWLCQCCDIAVSVVRLNGSPRFLYMWCVLQKPMTFDHFIAFSTLCTAVKAITLKHELHVLDFFCNGLETICLCNSSLATSKQDRYRSTTVFPKLKVVIHLTTNGSKCKTHVWKTSKRSVVLILQVALCGMD